MDVIRRTQAVCKRGIALLNLFESNRHTFLEHIHHDRYYEHRVKDARLNLSSRSGVWRRDWCSPLRPSHYRPRLCCGEHLLDRVLCVSPSFTYVVRSIR
jgi:hypothetical protein